MSIFLTILLWYFIGVVICLFLVYISNKFDYLGDKTSLPDAIFFSIFSYASIILVFIVILVIIIDYVTKLCNKISNKIYASKFFQKLNEWFMK